MAWLRQIDGKVCTEREVVSRSQNDVIGIPRVALLLRFCVIYVVLFCKKIILKK